MADQAAEIMAGPEYMSNNVVNLSSLKNGHILRVADERRASKPQKIVNVINHFGKLGNQLQKNDITLVLERYYMLRKDRRHPSKNKLIVDFYALPFKITPSQPSPPPPNRTARQSQRAENISIQNQHQAQILQLEKQIEHLQSRVAIVSKQRDKYRKRYERELVTNTNLRSRNVSKTSEILALSRQIEKLESQVNARKFQTSSEVLTRKLTENKAIIKDLKSEIASNELKIVDLEAELQKIETEIQKADIVQTKQGVQYIQDMRESVFNCAMSQVPLQKIPTVIKDIGEVLFKKSVSDLPSVATIRNVIEERRAIMLIQAVDSILKSTRVNLAWDATSLKGHHINEGHVWTDERACVLDVRPIEGGTANDYLNHIKTILGEADKLYADANGIDAEEVLSQIKQRICSTLSDRAVVNKVVSKGIGDWVGHDVLDLYCNIHPLDGLSIAYRKACKSHESECGYKSDLFGTDSALEKIMYNKTKLKYKAKGDPGPMAAYFSLYNMSPHLIVRYVGNRFHILFELAGNLFYIKDRLIDFLKTTCTKSPSYTNQMIKDLSSNTVLRELVVGGLFGKVLTGPWMKVMYRQKDLSNIGSSKLLTYMVDKLKCLKDCPRLIFDDNFCCFELPADAHKSELSKKVHACLLEYEADEETLNFISLVAEDFLTVIERQAADYLPGGKYADMEPEMIVLGENAPADNIMAETILGLHDHLRRRAPNASDSYMAAKTCFPTNKTNDWIKALPDSGPLLNKCISYGRKLKQGSIKRAAAVKLEIQKRTKAKSQQKSDKDRKKFTKNVCEAMKSPSTFMEKILELDPTIPKETLDTAHSLLLDPSSIIGESISWKWIVGSEPTIYYYSFTKFKKSGTYSSVYWSENETFDDAESAHNAKLSDVIADMLMSDLWITS